MPQSRLVDNDAAPRAAYQAYAKSLNIDPVAVTRWEDLSESMRASWRAALTAGIMAGVHQAFAEPGPGRVYRMDK